ncbi:MAG: SDR family oxidoreductase [Actinomycetota bacterium]
MDLDLSGKTAVVTGASVGIGAAAVRQLAGQGARVAFCARGAEAVEHLAAEVEGSVGLTADMTDAASTAAFLAAVDEALGRVDILVNNVGASPSRNFLYMTDDDWAALHQLNVMSAVRCSRHVIPAMREAGWGRIVMVSSPAAFYPNPATVDYAATKAAMVATAKALATKYGRDGILVNTVHPGLIHTPMWERAATELAEATGSTMEDVIARNGKSVPVGRYGTADEVANMITFLCSEAASYCNGSVFTVDGGSASHV